MAAMLPLIGTLEDLFEGPQALGHADRLLILEVLTGRLKERFSERLIAIAVYGSVGQGADGPFSDLEIWAALADGEEGPRWRETHEWVWGAGKAEVNLFAESAIRARAAEVDEGWALSHGKFVHARALFEAEERTHFVEDLREIATTFGSEARDAALGEAITAEIYELIGKLRNVMALRRPGEAPRHILDLAKAAALTTALAGRYCFESGSTLFEEASKLNGPRGYDSLIDLARRGNLRDTAAVLKICEAYWAGIPAWAAGLGLDLTPRLRAGF